MRWSAASLVALVGCGRIAFDAAPPDGAGEPGDLCPAVAGMQLHDEDGDGVGDECDPCPHMAGPTGDRDGDGVGDACDPAPDTPGQAIRAFASFADGAPSGWTIDRYGGTTDFTFEGDEARVALPSDAVAMLTIPDPDATDVLVDTAVVVTAKSPMDAGNPARNFAVIDAFDPATDSGLMHGAVADYSIPDQLSLDTLVIVSSIGSGVYDTAILGADFAYGARYSLRFTRHGAERDVAIVGPSGVESITSAPPQAGGRLGLRARGITAAFSYVIVIY